MIYLHRGTCVEACRRASHRQPGRAVGVLLVLLALLAPAMVDAVTPAATASAACTDVRIWISYRLPSGASGSSGAVDGIENIGFHDAQTDATTVVLANRNALPRVVRIMVAARHVIIRMPAKSLATVQIGGCPGPWCTQRIPALAIPSPALQPA